MKKSFLLKAMPFAVLCAASAAHAQEPAPSDAATKVYRQVMPDGRIIYSDTVQKGGAIDHAITVDPPIKGNLWSTEAGQKPVTASQAERSPVNRVISAPPIGRKKTVDEATSDVIRAEMFLEDARKRQAAGVEPLPGERTGNVDGKSRLNEAYERRQNALRREVAEADAALRKAIAERDGLRRGR